jgi:hypothetical protein
MNLHVLLFNLQPQRLRLQEGALGASPPATASGASGLGFASGTPAQAVSVGMLYVAWWPAAPPSSCVLIVYGQSLLTPSILLHLVSKEAANVLLGSLLTSCVSMSAVVIICATGVCGV